MLSNEMYDLLRLIPRYPNTIDYASLKTSTELKEENMLSYLREAKYDKYEYINLHSEKVLDGTFSRTEKGQAAIEAYEQDKNNQQTMEKSLCAAKWALVAAAVSAITSVIALLSNFC